MSESRYYQFYKQCLEKGYTDMSDATQSLKAKVIAADLNIKYKNIAATFDEAKALYDMINEERARQEAMQQITGTHMISLLGNSADEVAKVYLCDDGRHYYTVKDNPQKYFATPALNVKSGSVLLYTHHPSKAVYTGAAVGGVVMGGVHYTQPYVDEKASSTGNGYIDVVAASFEFTLKRIELSKTLLKKFKRDSWVQENLSEGKYIYCYDQKASEATSYMVQTALKQTNFHDRMSMISVAADSERLTIKECNAILGFLNRIFVANFPPSDEELYQQALAMGGADTSAKIKEGIELFEVIADYKDSSERIAVLKEKYEEVLQFEKEQAILQKEAKQAAFDKKKKAVGKVLPIILALILTGAAAFWFINSNNQKKEDYQAATAYMQSGDYQGAIEIYDRLGDYNDSAKNLNECCLLWVQQAQDLVDEGDFAKALETLKSLKDSTEGLDLDSETRAKLDAMIDREDQLEIQHNVLLAIDYRDIKYLVNRAKEGIFKKLNTAEIKSMIVGNWYHINSQNTSRKTRHDYKANGTVDNLDAVRGSNAILTHDYTIEGDSLKVFTSVYDVYDLGNGYILKVNQDDRYGSDLMWKR